MHENQTPLLINDHPEADIPVYFAIAISSKLAENKQQRRQRKSQIASFLAFWTSTAPTLRSVVRWSFMRPARTTFPGSMCRVLFIEGTSTWEVSRSESKCRLERLAEVDGYANYGVMGKGWGKTAVDAVRMAQKALEIELRLEGQIFRIWIDDFHIWCKMCFLSLILWWNQR